MIYKIGTKGLEECSVKSRDKRNELKRGTVLHLNGYDDPDFVVVKDRGMDGRNPGYGAMYDTINLTEFSQSRHEALNLEYIGNKNSGRIQTYYTDEVLPEEQVRDIEAYAGRVAKYREEIGKKETAAREKAIAELPGQFSFLECTKNSKKSSHALGASNLKRELKEMFPGIKFSVKSETFSGGDSIDVSWTDGPTQSTIQSIIDKYSQGSFDGMIDLYEYDRDNIWVGVFGGAKYVSANRHESADAIRLVAKKLGYDVELGKWNEITNLDNTTKQMIYRECRQTDFYKKPETPTKEVLKESASDVVIGEYKGHPTISLPCNGKGFTFGLAKAKAVLEYIANIKKFVESEGER